MKRLLSVILIAALGWSGYWFVGAKAARNGFEQWFDARQSEGWLAEQSEISVAGFPNRFDTTFDDIALADPETGVAWSAPFFQLLSLSYRPNHLIAIWPDRQQLAFPDQKIAISSEDMKASVVLGADPSLPLERSNLAVAALGLRSDAGWAVAADSLQLALHRAPETAHSYRFALSAVGFAPSTATPLSNGHPLPHRFKTIEADLVAGFDRAWDRRALEEARPQPEWIEIRKAEIVWGDLELHAAGRVTVSPAGYPVGEITLRATNWREIVAIARGSGQIPPGVLDAIVGGLELLSGLAGNPQRLDIPLNFRNGATRIGPVAIAPAPRLVLR
ncbi:DUF2125 domain-containing protein [Shimia sp.]|uniref:DUF2125 domain-containing protein n=1 Tax=Shimia sp. TaxID=1954381 RepID=UPI003564A6D9